LWRASAHSLLRHVLVWAYLAWATWCLAGFLGWPALHFLALSLTACAGVAVLGARRPTVTVWHLAVGFLLLFLLRPFWEGLGDWHLDGFHVAILGTALAVVLGNYLPTRLGAAAVLLGVWCGFDLARLAGAIDTDWPLAWLSLAAVPWLALVLARRPATTEFDAVWLTFRDRFGFVWAQRMRDQFNHAAHNAGWPVYLGWGGLRPRQADQEKPLAMMRSALRRFEMTDDTGPSDGYTG
jgi:hypothetical protein